MSQFNRPSGNCFQFGDEVPAADLSTLLCRVVSFLQEVDPYTKLHKYDDWWEHDGLHFSRGPIDFDAFFGLVNSAKRLLETTPDDDYVFVGIAPEDNSWYLRYRVEWDDDETNPVGRSDVILTRLIADQFRQIDWQELAPYVSEVDAESFYAETIL